MKTGFIAILGRPNVGKSTLLNAMLGEKIAIVSKKPQTTRTRITGILTRGEEQFVFLDTPGMIKAKNRLGDYMVKTISNTIGEVDACLFVVEAGVKPGPTERNILERIGNRKLPAILVINKTDRVGGEAVGDTILSYKDLYAFEAVVPISAANHKGVDIVIDEASHFLSEGPWYFAEDELTDQPERQIAAEMIREKILRTIDDEIPHGTAVMIEEFKEEGKLLRIRAEIFCEREAHKRILIGKQGAQLKKIGSYAREDLESFFGMKVFLDLWVKVKENWRDDVVNLNHFGFNKNDLG
ncbi:MAG: GTPase Era [Ruminococcaceae bacterium]|nr:GTPase Era [Oscillospiraceae bacterium]